MISIRSEITKKVLNYFYINPDDSLYVNELQRKLGVDKRNLVKKIRELEEDGILKNQSKGNLKLYSINREYPLYEEYKKIVLRTVGFENLLKKILKKIKGVKKAYIFGSYANNKMDVCSDIDILVIGSHSIKMFQKEISKLQSDIKREINAVNMEEFDFEKRIREKDPFVAEILKNKHIEVI